MTEQALPLYQLFSRLRQLADLSLGPSDYELLLRSVQAGKGLSSREALARLCRALWLKSNDPGLLQLFQHHFEEVIPQFTPKPDATAARDASRESSEAKEISEQQDIKAKEMDRQEQETTDQVPPGVGPGLTGQGPTERVDLDALRQSQDEIQEALARLKAQSQAEVMPQAYYSFTSDYLPVTRRQMKQHWRYLRRAIREGPPVELDVEATVDRLAREGLLTDPVMRPRRTNRTELVLLLDQDGSMVPFHRLSQRLADTAVRGGRLGKADIYYFHNCPNQYFYKDPFYREHEPAANRLEQMHPLHTSVLIFSDAGAARGNKNAKRVAQTRQFVNRLRQSARHIAWLNPMPQARWTGNTAGTIAQFVPMFEINPLGLQEAIKTLRGRRPHAQEGVR